jgi:hypothetical protein
MFRITNNIILSAQKKCFTGNPLHIFITKENVVVTYTILLSLHNLNDILIGLSWNDKDPSSLLR